MSSLEDICAQLGFLEGAPDARGHPNVLRASLQSYSQNVSWIKNIDELAELYLHLNGTKMVRQSDNYLNYPRDREKILELITEAFKLLRRASSTKSAEEMSSSQADITDSANNASEYLPSDSIADLSMSGAEAEEDQQLSEGRIEEISSGIDTAVYDETSAAMEPLSTRSKKDLVVIIKKWMDDHPSKRFPEVAAYDSWSLQNQFATRATLGGNEEEVWIVRIGVLEQYLARVLDRGDGNFILLKAQYLRKHGGHVYFPWLGGDLGFSNTVIAHHKVQSKQRISMKAYAQKNKLDGDDVLNDHDITKADLEPGLFRTVEKVVKRKGDQYDEQSDSSLSSFESLVPLMRHWKAEKSNQSKMANEPKKKRTCMRKPSKAIKMEPEEEPFQVVAPYKPVPNFNATGRAIFHFYLSDPTLGAIPSIFSLSVLPTHKRFFTLATAAYRTTLDLNRQVTAASVRVSSVERPIVVRADGSGKSGWEEVKRVVCENGSGRGMIEVEVRCIAARMDRIG